MFRRLPDAAPASLLVTVDGNPLECREGDSVAAALFAAGYAACRTTAVTGTPRGPYCMMGICYDCLVEIDGRPNQQGCMIRVRPGMRIERQRGAREVRL